MAQEVIQAVLEVSTNSIRALREEIKGYRKELEVAEIGTESFDKASKDLAKAQSQLKNALTLGKKEVSELDTSYDGLVRQMAELRSVWKSTTDEVERNNIGRQIAGINTQLKDLDGSIGNFQRNVGDYQGKIIATGKKTGETLAKTVAPALQENVTLAFDWAESLQGMGEVWKEIGGSVKAMVKQIGLLKIAIGGIIAGAVIGGVIALWNAFKGAEEAVVATVKSMSGLEKALIDIEAQARKETLELETLYSITQDLSASYETRNAAAAKLQEMYPAYLGNLSREKILAGEAAEAYRQLNNDILGVAKSQAAFAKLTELQSVRLSPEWKALEKSAKAVDDTPQKYYTKTTWVPNASGRGQTAVESKEYTKEYQDNLDRWGADLKALQEATGRRIGSFEDFVKVYAEEEEMLTSIIEESIAARVKSPTSGSPSSGGGTSSGGDGLLIGDLISSAQMSLDEKKADTFGEEADILEARYNAEVEAALARVDLEKATEDEITAYKLIKEEEYLIAKMELYKQYFGEGVADAEEGNPLLANLKAEEAITEDAMKANVKYADVVVEGTKKQERAIKSKRAVQEAAAVAESSAFKTSKMMMQAGAALFEENTVAHKAFSAAQAVMDTYKGASAALANGGGWPWGVINFVSTLAMGVANVKKILETKTDGSMPDVGGATVYNAPAVVQEVPVTRTLTGEAEEEQIQANSQTRVVLVYSDVEEAANRVRVQQTESSF